MSNIGWVRLKVNGRIGWLNGRIGLGLEIRDVFSIKMTSAKM